MAEAAAAFRHQRASRLLNLCAVGKFADAAFECCAVTVNPVRRALFLLYPSVYIYFCHEEGR